MCIRDSLQELTRYWVDLAKDIPGFRLHTPLDTVELGAVSLFSIDQCDARWVEQELRNTHGVHVKFRQIRHISGLRVSPSIYTQKNDLCRFVEALKQVAASR